MISQLTEMLSRVQYRYAHSWAAESLPSAQPCLGQVDMLFDRMDDELNVRVVDCFKSQTAQLDNTPWFHQLFVLKRNCIIDSWPHQPNALPNAKLWCMHDLVVYARFLNLLHQAYRRTDGWLADADKPSLTSLELHLDWRVPKPTRLVAMLGERARWIESLRVIECTNPYRMALNRLGALASPEVLDDQVARMLKLIVDALQHYAPTLLCHETEITKTVNLLQKQLLRQSTGNTERGTPKQLLKLVLSCNGLPVEVVNETVENYLGIWVECFDELQLTHEIDFWKNSNLINPPSYSHDCVAYIVKRLSKQAFPESGFFLPPESRIKWDGTVREFVNFFHPLIVKKRLLLKGHNDMQPLVSMLSQIFAINKSRGKGLVASDSLISYFKKVNAGEQLRQGITMIKMRVPLA